MSTCKSSTCKTCPMIMESNTFKSTVTGKVYDCQDIVNCKSENGIYLITCMKCGLQCVGETSVTYQRRMGHYRSDINCKKPDRMVLRHFLKKDHNISDIKVQPIEICPKLETEQETRKFRLQGEDFWMK